MKNKIKKINDRDFDRAVLFPRRPAVVFFTAGWSEAGEAAFPLIEAAADKYRTKAAFFEMNVDENSIIPTAYGVRRIPAVLTFTAGRLDEPPGGRITEKSLTEKIEQITAPDRLYKTVGAVCRKTAARVGTRVVWLLSELF